MNTTTNGNAAIIVAEQYALTPTNTSVKAVARRFRWQPETAVRRIKEALPAPLEQQIYLAIAPEHGESGLLPESMAKLLRMFLGDRSFELEDIAPDAQRRGTFEAFADFLGECIMLLKILTADYPGLGLSIAHAGMVALHYGPDNTDILIEIVDSNLEELCTFLGVSNGQSYARRMRICLSIIAGKIIPDNKQRGVPDPLDLSDFLNMPSSQRSALRRIMCEECPDYLEGDSGEMRSYRELALLKELELI
jgi:hypothetical protein